MCIIDQQSCVRLTDLQRLAISLTDCSKQRT